MKSKKWMETYTNKFVKSSQERFPGRFDYSRLEYINQETPVTLGCPDHGFFEIQPRHHHRSPTGGCQKCNRKLNPKVTREEFVKYVYEFHQGRYTYEETDYIDAKTPVKIHCPKHGYFWQVASDHRRGGCRECNKDSRKLTQQEFEVKANKVHNGRYTYEKAMYEHGDKPVTIHCPFHGDFQQNPHQHLSGQGCSKCKSKAYGWEGMYLYILGCATHPYVKVGITKKSPEQRAKDIKSESGIEFEPYSNYYFADGGDALCIEMDMLKWLKGNYDNIEEKFNGYREAFVCSDYDEVLDKMHEFVAGHFDQQM